MDSIITRNRRNGLGPDPICSPSQWVNGIFAFFDLKLPGWRLQIDPAALELALIDLVGDDSPRPLNCVFVDALAEILAQIQAGNQHTIAVIQQVGAKVAACPQLPEVLTRLEFYFSPGFILKNPLIRSIRVATLRDFVAILEPPILETMNKFVGALDSRERAEAKRHARMTRPDLANAPAPALLPLEAKESRAKASVVLEEVERKLSPRAAKALRVFLAGGGSITASAAAGEAGISSPTMTRAIDYLGEVSKRRLSGASAAEKAAFVQGLTLVASFRSEAG